MGFYDRLKRADVVFFERLSNVSVYVAELPAIRGVFDNPAALVKLEFGGTIEHQELQLVIRSCFDPGLTNNAELTITDDATQTSTKYRIISPPLADGSGLTLINVEVLSVHTKTEFNLQY